MADNNTWMFGNFVSKLYRYGTYLLHFFGLYFKQKFYFYLSIEFNTIVSITPQISSLEEERIEPGQLQQFFDDITLFLRH